MEIEETMRIIHELVSKQSEIDALKRLVSQTQAEIKRLEDEFNELAAKYDLE